MISTRGRYAIRVMIDLAEHENGGWIPLKDIATRQGISKKYLEIIVKDMVAGGLLVGASGKGGGYQLLRRPEEYPVGEIIELDRWRRSPVWPAAPRPARGHGNAKRCRSGRSTTS